MFHRWAALVLVLALCAISPKNAAGQSKQQPRGHGAGGLIRNFPNPFNPETSINFMVGDSTCVAGSEQHEVSMQILNILAQPVAIPTLQSPSSAATTPVPTSAVGQPVTRLRLACGQYVARWDGNYQGTLREAASGVYILRMWIDGVLKPALRMYNGK
jgi:hypothetical protein